ncbi:FMN-binding glutamate synthase family protein [Thermaerobacter subterraneus]|uniref:Glutamate synthase family protein n=1 Tax=Thermaerobacter subterraneus DSM 13965 TaxID=867903 RepID=K6NYW7_9FIRM|nr:FMN-binding glutamate synthase family protein [Thermaerobacter subterraneus]EKP94040.1 glutamate synthase family protein [Thermaerobacter subterraneus DSM 13965]
MPPAPALSPGDGRLFIIVMIAVLVSLGVAAAVLWLARGLLLDRLADRVVRRFLKDPYRENLWDLAVGMQRIPPPLLLELELRADKGELLERPLGGLRRYSRWEDIAFNPAQLARRPLPPGAQVDTSAVLGPRAARPLHLATPLLVSAMGYGIGVSKAVALALARGAHQAGTAYNAGSGPVVPEILEAGGPVILQYTGGPWNQVPDQLARAAMVEIRLGHGARGALGRLVRPDRLPEEARRRMGAAGHKSLLLEAPLPETENLRTFRELVDRLRHSTGGAPVGIKLVATHHLEHDLLWVLEAGVDVIAIDGSEGGTSETPPILADDFGIPTLYALVRAAALLEAAGVRQRVSLLAGGGLRTPGEFLKALALGADAVYLGTAVIMAATHGQLSKAIPFEPITQLAWASGQLAGRFDPGQGARTVANFLKACTLEMAEAARALGRDSLRAVDRSDLVARTPEAADLLGLPPAWRPPRSRS